MDYSVEKANEYILNNKSSVNSMYRMKYHMLPPIGWMNDPNGLVYFDSYFHVFYQYYPYDSCWGPMHWGHIRTKDFILYDNLSVALAPLDKYTEYGCFSGGAIIDNNKINLIYTRHIEYDDIKEEYNYRAISDDTINYIKGNNPIFNNESLPSNYSKRDFRDPYPYKIGNSYYIFMGAKDIILNQGVIIVLKGESLDSFKYDFTIGPFYELGDMAECPSYHRVGNKDVLIVSGCNVGERANSFKNPSSSVFIIGDIDFNNKNMNVDEIKEIDKGDSYYAPQFINNYDLPIMLGWFEMWGKKIPTHELNHKWVGAFTLPRILEYKNNTIYQKPYDISKYFILDNSDIVSKYSNIKVNATDIFSIEFISNNGSFIIGQNELGVFLDTTNTNNYNPCIRRTDCYFKNVNLDIYLDNSGIEIFINDGLFTISSRIYLDNDYKLKINGNVDITKYRFKND